MVASSTYVCTVYRAYFPRWPTLFFISISTANLFFHRVPRLSSVIFFFSCNFYILKDNKGVDIFALTIEVPARLLYVCSIISSPPANQFSKTLEIRMTRFFLTISRHRRFKNSDPFPFVREFCVALHGKWAASKSCEKHQKENFSLIFFYSRNIQNVKVLTEKWLMHFSHILSIWFAFFRCIS